MLTGVYWEAYSGPYDPPGIRKFSLFGSSDAQGGLVRVPVAAVTGDGGSVAQTALYGFLAADK
jgi:hypothetical protein